MAVALQSRASEVFAVDIHPAAKIGKGVLLDHGTGVVIGETAEVGNNVSILQNVTLGGTGKEHGDRHPKVSDNVLIGASATILGNIRIGKGAQVAAGSLVLKPVPPKTMVAGSPAKEVGKVLGNPALDMEQQWNDRATKESGASGTSNIMEPCDGLFAAPVQPGASEAKTSSSSAVKEERHSPLKAVPDPVQLDPEISVTSEAVLDAKKVLDSRPGAPPLVLEPVDAVTSDVAAAEKWGVRKDGDDMEYMI